MSAISSPAGRGPSMGNVESSVGRVTDSSAFENVARAGFAASGVLHVLLGWIAARLAFGSGGTADQSGALATLGSQTGGAIMLWVVAVGLAALGLWQLTEAVVGKYPGEKSGANSGGSQNGDDSPGAKDRLKAVGLAVVYAMIAVSAARYAMGSGEQTSQRNAGMSAQLMQHGWGKALLVVVALAVIGVGGYHVYKGATKKFEKNLKGNRPQWVTPLGMTGYIAKGAVLGGAGVLVLVATFTADPAKASGIDVALKTLGAAPFGKFLLIAAGLGIVAYGLYNMGRARYGRM